MFSEGMAWHGTACDVVNFSLSDDDFFSFSFFWFVLHSKLTLVCVSTKEEEETQSQASKGEKWGGWRFLRLHALACVLLLPARAQLAESLRHDVRSVPHFNMKLSRPHTYIVLFGLYWRYN